MFRLAALTLVVGACSDSVIVVGELQEVGSLKAIPNRNLDLLFVVDNSGSMLDQQASLAAAFPHMMDRLAELDGGLPNLHIGVITSDLGTANATGAPAPDFGVPGAGGCSGVGDNGALRTTAAMTGNFISDLDDGAGGRATNYTGELRDVFGALAQVGGVGCGFEQHLAAMRASFGNPTNAGFFRAEANLAVVVIADEDDCSVLDGALFSPDPALGPLQSYRCTRHGVICDPDMDSPGDKTNCVPRADSLLIENTQSFVDALLAQKGDPRAVMVAGIVGDPAPVATEVRQINGESQLALAPSCTFVGPSGNESAEPAVRLGAFLDAFPGRSQLTSICSSDLTVPLTVIGGSAKKLVGDPCLDTLTLADAAPEPGVQPACEVIDLRDSAPSEPLLLPSCDTATGDCYELVADPIACPTTDDHLRVRFRRAAAADDLWTSIRCQLR
jgi:hypothetical protein